MQCSSCGTLQEMGVEQCPVCEPVSPASEILSECLNFAESPTPASKGARNYSTSKLIEFPGVTRSSVPQWRKELSERVREVHEKRAREAAIEAAQAEQSDKAVNVAPPLELLPQTDAAPPLNPLVTAALRRIERAHRSAPGLNRSAGRPRSAALAYATDNEYRPETLPEVEIAGVAALDSLEPQSDGLAEIEPAQPEKVHNLVVVPASVPESESQKPNPKPRRMIADNDHALNYLDSIPTSVRVEVAKYHPAPAFSRALGAMIDLIVVTLLCAPFAALVELTNGNWRALKVAALAAAVFSVMSFLYFTISTALTGRTVGMRLFSLRVIDARTGLIPTGKQSAGRAVIYLGTILTFGLASLYVLIDSDRQTAGDRFTRTSVIVA